MAVRQTLIVRIDVEQTGSLTEADVADVLRFRLNLTTLNAEEVDFSALEIKGMRLLSVDGGPIITEPR